MQKTIPYILIGGLVSVVIIQFINSRSSASELERIQKQTNATIKQVKQSEQQAIERARSLEKRLLEDQITTGEISSTNNEAIKTAIGINKRVDNIKGIADQSRDIIEELRESIQ